MDSAAPSSDYSLGSVGVSDPGVIPVLVQLPNLRSAEEDWTGVSAQAKRRRLQNRINQRSRRQKLKKEKEEKEQEAAADEVLPGNAAGSTSSRILPAGPCLLGKSENRRQLAQFAAQVESYLGRPSPVHLQDTVRCNVFLALAHNVRLIGFDDGWLTEDAMSPFSRPGPAGGSWTTMMPDVPANMRPTVLQLTVEHHPWVDLFPCPRMRDNLLRLVQARGEDAVDEDDLCRDYVDAAGSHRGTEHGAAVIVWSDPWSPNGWELTAGFVRKWAWLLHGCVELQAGTNAWRTRRGLPRLRFPGC